jgi:LacI family transcriptional regulator
VENFDSFKQVRSLQMKEQATLKHISGLLQLSISTVSRALKNHPDISENTKKKVMAAASMLEYEPNNFAINLRTNKSRLIGVIVSHLSNQFNQSFITAMEEEAKKNGYSLLILLSGDDPQTELENLRICKANRVAAVFISISPQTKDITAFLKHSETQVPVIFFDKVPETNSCNKVCIADKDAAVLAAEEIILSKKKNVLAVFGDADLSITQKRKNAFVKKFEENGRHSLQVLHASSTENAIHILKNSLTRNKPDIIFAMSDEILTGVMKVLQIMKIKIPGEIAVVSISNDGFIPRLYEPEITFVETSGFELGKLAFKRLLDFQQGKTFFQEVLLQGTLVAGKSL